MPSKFCPVIDLTWEEMKKMPFVAYINTLIVDGKIDNVPIFILKMPEEWQRMTQLDENIIKESMTNIGTSMIDVKEVAFRQGIYEMTEKVQHEEWDVEDIVQHVMTLENSSKYNWRELYSRTTLKAMNNMKYMQNITYSYLNEVYNRDAADELPKGWNLNDLQHVLHEILEDDIIEGTSNSMTYLGSPHTHSPYHWEDYCMASASYNLKGADKLWIAAFPYQQRDLLKDLQENSIYHKCRMPLNHKLNMIDVDLLEELNIEYYLAVQKPGYMVVTMPTALHQVTNQGNNWAEATNFICYRWQTEARGQNVICCKEQQKRYQHPAWQKVQHALYSLEKELKEEHHNVHLRLRREILEEEVNDAVASVSPPKRRKLFCLPKWPASNPESSTVSSKRSTKPASNRADVRNVRMTRATSETTQPADTSTSSTDNDNLKPSRRKRRTTEESDQLPTMMDLEESINRMAARNKKNKKVREAQEQRPKVKRIRSPDTYKRSPAAEHLRDLKNNAKKSCEAIMAIMKKHNDGIKRLSEEKYAAYQVKLEERQQTMLSAERRQNLNSMILKIFPKNFKHLITEGYVSYEIARDFIDGRDPRYREALIQALQLIKSNDADFWQSVTLSEQQWNSFFGVDERFRIPAHQY